MPDAITIVMVLVMVMRRNGGGDEVGEKLAWRRTQPYAVVNAAIVLGGGGRMRAVPLGPSL
eukprot:5342832-Pyramimonas_sp.AAC.1